MRPLRLRDFIQDKDGWLYAVSAYDNNRRAGCVLRYVPDPAGERSGRDGTRYCKLDFPEAYARIATEKPGYLDLLHRVPLADITNVFKPEERMAAIIRRDSRVRHLSAILGLKPGLSGCTGSLLLGLETTGSDIDLVVYGHEWFLARDALQRAVQRGDIGGMTAELWQTVYRKRVPEIPYDQFVLHESRKWNRGVVEGTYFDLLYTRDYGDLPVIPSGKGTVLGKQRIEAVVTGAEHAFDSPAEYAVEHDSITRVFSFTHTYCGQAFPGETIEACGVCEQHGDEQWLIVGTTREARGEYILSKTLLEANL